MDLHHTTSDDRHREIARQMGFDDQQMELLDAYLSLPPEGRAVVRQMLERGSPRREAAQAA